jgi:ATP/maltotriose-dependent transcriptional regulator MalT
MNEINIFQSSVWFALIALNAFFIWKYIHLNKTLKTQKPVIHTFTEKKVENKKSESTLNNTNIQELSEIIKDIKKEDELNKIESVQRLLYYGKYVLDPITKKQFKLLEDYKLNPNRFKKQVKERLLENFPELSEREILMCTYIVNGISSKEIGALLKLSNGTVRVYKNKLKTKLKVPNGFSLKQHLDIFIDEE